MLMLPRYIWLLYRSFKGKRLYSELEMLDLHAFSDLIALTLKGCTFQSDMNLMEQSKLGG
jgi:hypothetical protein